MYGSSLTTAYREITKKNAHITGKLESSMVTGLINVRLYATSISSEMAD